jgi:SAM-dependent methyltransferase
MFTLDKVVPWGRSFDEYRLMFALGDDDLDRRIIGCGDGPASFNAEATRRGARVISCDPMYRWSSAEIDDRILATRDEILEQTRRNADEFVWDTIGSVDALGARRMAAMTDFLADYEPGKAQGRYVAAALPALPFADASFDLALCSHLLFLYTTQLGEAFHRDAIREMCRVAGELRIFPLVALGGQRSPYVDQNATGLRSAGFSVSIETVPYEFQRGGNEMMRIHAHGAGGGHGTGSTRGHGGAG